MNTTLRLFTFAEITAQMRCSVEALREATTMIPAGYEVNGRDAWDAEQVDALHDLIGDES